MLLFSDTDITITMYYIMQYALNWMKATEYRNSDLYVSKVQMKYRIYYSFINACTILALNQRSGWLKCTMS